MSYILDALKRAETTKNENECILPVNQADVPFKKLSRRWIMLCLIILLCLGLIGILVFSQYKENNAPIPVSTKPKALKVIVPLIETKPEPEFKLEPETKLEPDIPKPSVIPQLVEMPPAFQNSIPSLQFKGHFYSTDPEKGSVLIGDKTYSVGNEIAPGIVLEAVTPTGVILTAHHTQFRIEILGNWVY